MSSSLLKWYHDMGVEQVIDNKPRIYHEKATTKPLLAQQVITSPSNLAEIVQYAQSIAQSCNSLSELREAVNKFEHCELKKTVTNTVFADGNPDSEIMLIGEAPGANEDIQGIPFCGDSGKLLNDMLRFIGLEREKNFYITNSIFWRPPGNRRPTADEIAMCYPFVERHIALFNPKLIILVGATAVTSVLGINDSMSAMRHKMHQYHSSYLNQDIPVMTIFHPSYLLRQPSQKKLMWFDLLKLKHYLADNGIRIT
jgi:DNA polymerase